MSKLNFLDSSNSLFKSINLLFPSLQSLEQFLQRFFLQICNNTYYLKIHILIKAIHIN